MSHSTYFVQECPTCGRTLHVRVEYLGRQVACQHCHAQFEACDKTGASGCATAGVNLLDRADQLLESVRHRQRPMA